MSARDFVASNGITPLFRNKTLLMGDVHTLTPINAWSACTKRYADSLAGYNAISCDAVINTLGGSFAPDFCYYKQNGKEVTITVICYKEAEREPQPVASNITLTFQNTPPIADGTLPYADLADVFYTYVNNEQETTELLVTLQLANTLVASAVLAIKYVGGSFMTEIVPNLSTATDITHEYLYCYMTFKYTAA